MKIDIDIGKLQMGQDHQALARLIEEVRNICGDSSNPDCNCDRCPEGKPKRCFDSLTEMCHEILVLMLEHFRREDALMKALSPNRSTREHCTAHRSEHGNFSTRYNHAVTQINAHHPAVGRRTLDSLIVDWSRCHVLVEYDMKLAALLNAQSPTRR